MDLVRSERRGAVALLTLDRPQALNALDVAALEARIGEVARDPGARARAHRRGPRVRCGRRSVDSCPYCP